MADTASEKGKEKSFRETFKLIMPSKVTSKNIKARTKGSYTAAENIRKADATWKDELCAISKY